MFFANLIFVVSHLIIHPAVHLNTSKALTSLQLKRKANKKFTGLRYSFVLTRVKIKINGGRAPGCKNQADKDSNIISIKYL